MYSWLSSRKGYEQAKITFERGRALVETTEELQDKVISPILIEENFVVYSYCDWPQLFRVQPKYILKYPGVVEEIIETAYTIHSIIGLFDFNANNILFNPQTGQFLFIDFGGVSYNFTFNLFQQRIKMFRDYFAKAGETIESS
jgi:hypothetical protein